METIYVASFQLERRHPFIFERFDLLKAGESIVILNDHDPIPLYYQLTALKSDNFGWEYLQKGPDIWRVKITKGKLVAC